MQNIATKQFTLSDFNIHMENEPFTPKFTFSMPPQLQSQLPAQPSHKELLLNSIISALTYNTVHKSPFMSDIAHKVNYIDDHKHMSLRLIKSLHKHLFVTSMDTAHPPTTIADLQYQQPQWSNPLYWKYMGCIYYMRTNRLQLLTECFKKVLDLSGSMHMFCIQHTMCAFILASSYDLYNCNAANEQTAISFYYTIITNTISIKQSQMIFILYSANRLCSIYIKKKQYSNALDCMMALELTKTGTACMMIGYNRSKIPYIAELMCELKTELRMHYSTNPIIQQFIATRKYKVGKCCVCFGIKRLYKHDCLHNHCVCVCCYGKTTACPLCRFDLNYVRSFINESDDDDDDDDYNDDDDDDTVELTMYY